MALVEGETWDDYMDEEVYVTTDSGVTGFLAILKDYNDGFVLVEDQDGYQVEMNPEHVYGTWILEDW